MFRDERITETDQQEYQELIPSNYRKSMGLGQMTGYAVYDDVDGESHFFGIYLTTVHEGWLELVWEYIADPKIETTEKSLFFRHLISIDRKRRKTSLKGAFAELHKDEAWPDVAEALKLCGMETRWVDGNVYEFALSEVVGVDTLKKAADRVRCVNLSDADDSLRRSLSALMSRDDRPVPIPEKIDWDIYVQDLCFISTKGNVPSGAILILKQDDYIIIELSYSADALALPALFWNAYSAAVEKYGKDQRVLVPVVVNKTGLLVKKFVPTAARTEIITALMRF